MKLKSYGKSRVSQQIRWSTALLLLVTALVTTTGGSALASSNTKITSPKQLRIAYLAGGTSNTFLTTENTATMNTAKAYGARIQMFDPEFNATTQYNEMQSVISGGKFNAIILLPLSGTVMCPLVKQAIKKHILVVTGVFMVCGLDYKSGSATWYPGTVQSVPAQTNSWMIDFFKEIVATNTTGGQVAIFTGPAILTLSQITTKAATQVFAGTKFSVATTIAGDYTSPTAYTAAQNLFTSNPNINVVFVNYAGMTAGIIAAAQAAGVLNKISIYEAGGVKASLPAVANGTIKMSAEYYPGPIGKETALALIHYAQGKKVPRYNGVGDQRKWITQANWKLFSKTAY